AVELSNRGRTSRRGNFILGEWAPIHRCHHRLASDHRRRRGHGIVSGTGLATRVDACSLRVGGGREMKTAILIAAFSGWAVAQTTVDVVKTGAEVFAKTCSSGYCHGAKGVGAGAPRLSGRGFD